MRRNSLHIKRHVFIFAVATLLGIVTAYFYTQLFIIILLTIGAVFCMLVFIFSMRVILHACKKDCLRNFIYNLRKLRKPAIYCIIAFCIGATSCIIQRVDYENSYLPTVRANVYGEVDSVRYTELYTDIVLKGVKYDTTNLNTSLKGKVRVSVYGNLKDIEVGDYISCVGSIYSNELEYNEMPNNSLIADDYRYQMDVNVSSIELVKGDKDIFEILRGKVHNLFKNNMSENSFQISMAIFVGDTSYLNDATLQNFRVSGLAHLFAVSGLHIGLICGIVLLLLKFIQNAWFKFFIVFFVLLIYNFLCGFSPSIFRSSVMFLTMILAACFGEMYDSLTALSVSFLINIIINPLVVLTLGFMMSYAVVFCIILLTPIFKRKIRFLPRKVSQVVGMSVSAQIGILPIQAVYFSSISTFSLITNLIAIPIFTVVYYIFFFNIFVAIVIPKSLIISSFLLDTFTKGVDMVASIPYVNITVYVAGSMLLLYYVCVFCISKTRVFSLVISVIYVILLSLSFLLPVKLQNSIHMFSPHYEKTIMITLDDKVYVVSNSGKYTSQMQRFIMINKIKKIDYLFLYNSSDKISAYIDSDNVIYCRESIEQEYSISVYDNGGVALQIQSILLLFDIKNDDLYRVYLDFFDADYIISDNYIVELYAHYIPDKIISFNEIPYLQYDNYYSVRRHGSKTYAINKDY